MEFSIFFFNEGFPFTLKYNSRFKIPAPFTHVNQRRGMNLHEPSELQNPSYIGKNNSFELLQGPYLHRSSFSLTLLDARANFFHNANCIHSLYLYVNKSILNYKYFQSFESSVKIIQGVPQYLVQLVYFYLSRKGEGQKMFSYLGDVMVCLLTTTSDQILSV